MAGIGVFCELQHGEFTKGSLGLLGEAARLGGELGEPVHALVSGEVPDDAAAALGGHGATDVHVAEGEALGGRWRSRSSTRSPALQAEHDLATSSSARPSWPPTPPPAWPCGSARASSSTRSSSWPRAGSS